MKTMRTTTVIAAAMGVAIAASGCGDGGETAHSASTSTRVEVPTNGELVRGATVSEVSDLYRRALAAVNDPTATNATMLRGILCYSTHRLPDGQPSWTADFSGQTPDRGKRTLVRVVEVHSHFATVVERWTADPHIEADPNGEAQRTLSAMVSTREDGSEGPCLSGLDTAPVFPYGSDTDPARYVRP